MLVKRNIASTPETDPALDQRQLFAIGLDRARRLSHQTWTDHNTHDPGITILELLAYGLTDLAYRAGYPIEDLLAAAEDNSREMAELFFSARSILPCAPVTEPDYRKLLIDLKDVRNGWLLPAPLTLYATPAKGCVKVKATGAEGEIPITIRGRYSVLVDYMDGVDTAAASKAVLAALNAHRSLGDIFVGVSAVQPQPYSLCAEIDLAPEADTELVAARIRFEVDRFLAPPVLNYRLDEMLARKRADGSTWTIPELFAGPPLQNGFIDDEELAAAELRTEIHLSDIISVIMDIPGVTAIRDLLINRIDEVEGKPRAAAPENRWKLPVPTGRQPRLCDQCGRLVFYKRNLPIPAEPGKVATLISQLREKERQRLELEQPEDQPIPLGRFRRPAAYRSIQHEFPQIYGLSENGLSPGAPPERQAQALQLKGWMLFFDQIMAGYLAQLAHLRELFSMRPDLAHTYFGQLVQDFPDWQKIFGPGLKDKTLADTVLEPGDSGIKRRNRFLDHLLARYAEDFYEFTAIMQARFGMGPAQAASAKCTFLKDLPATGGERGQGCNIAPAGPAGQWNTDNVSGFERRVASLLDIGNVTRRNLSEVAYEMYTEIDSTPGDEFRFRVLHPLNGKILLSSSTHYVTPGQARAELEEAIVRAQLVEGYQKKMTVDGRHYFNIIDSSGNVIARRIEYFPSAAAMETAIAALIEHLRTYYSGEGMYLIEHILLLPQSDDGPTMDICSDTATVDPNATDPYSYRVTMVLPAFTGRFRDLDFRGFVEETLRREMPAHLLPRICWVNSDDMAMIEKAYRDWLAIVPATSPPVRAERLEKLIVALTHAKNVYPSGCLHPCGQLEPPPFVLGSAALGSGSESTES